MVEHTLRTFFRDCEPRVIGTWSSRENPRKVPPPLFAVRGAVRGILSLTTLDTVLAKMLASWGEIFVVVGAGALLCVARNLRGARGLVDTPADREHHH